MLDIDHTLLHAVVARQGAEIPNEEVETFTLHGELYSVKLRHHLAEFLLEAQQRYQIFLYTQGTRAYAEIIASIIDPEKKIIGGRIVSRTDTPELDGAKSLDRIFLGDTRMVVVVDDREDVWRGIGRSQLLLVQPFKYFAEGTDINNAPGALSTSDDADDSQLQHLLSALRDIHAAYYERVDDDERRGGNQRLAHTSEIIAAMRSTILRGCVLLCRKTEVRDIISQGLLKVAQMMGAEIAEAPDDRVTHLLCLENPAAVFEIGVQLRDTSFFNSTCVINADWIRACNWAMRRVDENSFVLGYLEKKFLARIGTGVVLKPPQSRSLQKSNMSTFDEDDDEDQFMKEIEAGLEGMKEAKIDA